MILRASVYQNERGLGHWRAGTSGYNHESKEKMLGRSMGEPSLRRIEEKSWPQKLLIDSDFSVVLANLLEIIPSRSGDCFVRGLIPRREGTSGYSSVGSSALDAIRVGVRPA
jgi:hypothetical protein